MRRLLVLLLVLALPAQAQGVLVALDGTEYVCSQKLGCPGCLTRKRANGKTESYHAMLAATLVAPGHAMALPQRDRAAICA